MVFEVLESKMNISENDTLGMDQDVFEQFTQGLYAYGIPIIFVIGTFGNLLSFKVFMFTSFGNHSSSIYIAALSISDTLFLLSLLISWLGGGRIGVLYVHSPVWCQVMIYVTYVCSFLSVWYVVLIMIDRYIVVCHSLHVPEWCTKRRARIATAMITIFGMVLYSHIFFTAEVTGENCTVEYKEFLHNILSIFIYTDTAITFIIPFAIIFFLNLVIIISIKRFQNRHEFLKDRKHTITDSTPENVLSKAQYRITRTFILVSVVLLVTNVPSHGIRFYIIVNSVYQQGTSVLMHAQHVFQIIYYFNFAVNFLLYSVSSSKFRKYISFRHLCGTCYRRRQRRSNAHMQYYR